jgi:hypothetical protein
MGFSPAILEGDHEVPSSRIILKVITIAALFLWIVCGLEVRLKHITRDERVGSDVPPDFRPEPIGV